MIKTFLRRCRITRDKFTRETRFLTITVLRDIRRVVGPRLLDASSSLTCSGRLTEDTMFTELFGLSPWSRALALSLLLLLLFLSLVRRVRESNT